MPAQYGKPYVGQQKNDAAAAAAIAEAVQRPRMRFVPIETREQRELRAVPHVRDRLVVRRIASATGSVGSRSSTASSCATAAVGFAASCRRYRSIDRDI